MNPQLSIIAAVAQNGAIGLNNKLLWHISDDLKKFKQLTSGHTLIMGRKTFESLPSGPLPNRRHIILTRDKTYTAKYCFIVNAFEDLLVQCDKAKENFVIGGAEIYDLLLPYSQKFYLTRVFTEPQADAFFPAFNEKEWHKDSESEIFDDEKSGLKYQYINFIRKNM